MIEVVSAPPTVRSVLQPDQVRHSTSSVADYVALTKPRLNVLVVATSAAGYYLGGPPAPDLAPPAVGPTGS